MGRKYEHKAAASFTICLAELQWLAEYSDRLKIKKSEVVNKLIREAMLNDKTDVAEKEGAPAYCKHCNEWPKHDVDTLECLECGNYNERLAARLKEKGIIK